MSEFRYSTDDLAKKFGVTGKTIRKWAEPLNLGIDRSGRAGFFYSEADYQKLVASRRPVQKPVKRQRKRAA